MSNHAVKTFKKGSYLYIEGDEDVGEIFIIQEGEIYFDCANDQICLYRKGAGAGDILGFISSMCGRPRMESAVSKTDATVLVFNRDDFLNLMNKNAEIALKVINNFADELRAYDEMIFSVRGKREIIPQDIQLYKLGCYFHDAGDLDHAYYIFSRLIRLFPASMKSDESRSQIRSMEERGIRHPIEPVKQGMNRMYRGDQIVFCQNEPGEALYLIKEGKVKIFKNHGNSQIMLSILKRGDIFGELAIVSNKPRNATAISDDTTVLIPITRENLVKMLQKSPMVLRKIYTSISERLWFTYIRIESRLYKRPLTRIYAFLENKLMEEKISLKSTKPYIFNFGIDELLKMTDLTQEGIGGSMDELLMDHNLNFNFGEIRIESPSEVSSKAEYYKSRDKLTKEEMPEVEKSPTVRTDETAIDAKVPNTTPENADETSSLFDELGEIIYLD